MEFKKLALANGDEFENGIIQEKEKSFKNRNLPNNMIIIKLGKKQILVNPEFIISVELQDYNFLNKVDFQDVKFDSKTGFLTVDGNQINNILKLDIEKSSDAKYASVTVQFDANLEVIGTSDTLGQINYNSKKDGDFSLQRNIGECKAKIKYKDKKGNLLFFK